MKDFFSLSHCVCVCVLCFCYKQFILSTSDWADVLLRDPRTVSFEFEVEEEEQSS